MKEFTQKLKEMRACDDAIEWSQGKSLQQAWETCPRGDWMLWLAFRLKVDDRKLTLAKALRANTVRHLMTDKRSLNAVDVAIAYGGGKATREDLDAAAAGAYTAACAASDYAAYAAYAAAAYAAYSYASDAYDASKNNEQQTADICRKILTEEIKKHF